MPLPRLLTAILAPLAVAILLAAGPVRAEVSPVYVVKGVSVDVTADSAAAAREQALAKGHREAFRRLMRRLLPLARVSEVPQIGYDRIAGFVRDFEISNERTSSVRYLADLTFRFQPQAIRQFLQAQELPFAETRSKPVVVLPVFGEGEAAVLWDDPNPWRQAWAADVPEGGLVPFAVPLGDLGDISAIGVDKALQGEQEALRAIAQRYGAGDVLVTQAAVSGDAEAGNATLRISSSRMTPDGGERTLVDSLRQQQDEKLAGLLARGARQVADALESAWKQDNLLRFDQRATAEVVVPLTGLDSWTTIKRRLDRVPVVAAARVASFKRDEAALSLDYYGSIDQLQRALAQSDLALRRDGAIGYRLTTREAASSEGESAGPEVEVRRLDDAGSGDSAPAGTSDIELRPPDSNGNGAESGTQ